MKIEYCIASQSENQTIWKCRLNKSFYGWGKDKKEAYENAYNRACKVESAELSGH